ncbi:hypothetical protein ACS0TY_029244 [Phlomoides rotata]
MFPRLFLIDNNPLCSVADRFETKDNSWSIKGDWRRPLYSWEEDNLQELLEAAGPNLKPSLEEDKWTWKLTKDGIYSAKTAYQELHRRKYGDCTIMREYEKVWNKLVPLKIAAFNWKMIQDRVPTMWNLLQRGAFNPNYSTKCRVCGNFDEDTTHLFFNCRSTLEVWKKVCNWFDLSNFRLFVKWRGLNKSLANGEGIREGLSGPLHFQY